MNTRINVRGYEVLVKSTRNATTIYYHVLLAEKALGGPMPKVAIVHHANGIKDDNRPENLIVLPDTTYHNLLHKRMDSIRACGNPDWRKCKFCGIYDKPENIYMSKTKRNIYHRDCHTL